MGIQNKEGALYFATGFDNSGLYSGRQEAMGIIKAMASEITSFDVFSGIGISAGIAFARAAKGAYDFEKQFQQSMKEVATLSSGIKGSLTDYMNQVVELTRTVPVLANDAAKALYQIVSAGHDGADGMKVLEVSAKAAVGGVTDTATAADAITTILNAYKMDASKAQEVSDQLFTTVRLGKTDFGQLGKSIAQAAPIASSFGIDIREVLAAVASITKQGVPTSEAMTKIRAAILGTANQLGDAAFKGRTFQEALQLIYDKAGGSSTKMKELLGTDEALQAALMITGKNAQSAAKDLEDVGNSASAAEEAFKEMASSAENQIKLLSNNITAFLRPLGETILKEISSVAQSMNEAFEDGSAQESLREIGALIVAVTTALAGYKGSILAVSAAKQIHATVTAILNKQRTIEIGKLILSQGFYDADSAAVVKNMSARVLLTKAIKTQTIAQLKNAAAMLTNPYVLAAAAFAGLGYAIYKVATAETEAERVQRRYNKAIEEQTRQLDELKNKTNGLVSIIKDENTTQYDKVKVYKQLQALMPTVFSNMDIEKLKLMDQLSLNKQINEEINRRERIGAQTKLIMAQRKYEVASAKYDKDVKDGLIGAGSLAEKNEAFMELELAKKIYSEIDNIQKEAKEISKPKELKIVSLRSNIDTLKSEIAELRSLVENEQEENNGWSPNAWLLDAKQYQLAKKEKELKALLPGRPNNEKEAAIQNKAHWTKQKEEATKALESIASAQKKQMDAGNFKGIDSAVVTSYKENIKKLKEAEKELKIYDTSSKQESEAEKQRKQAEALRAQQEKYSLLLDKQRLDRQRQSEDIEYQLAQTTIDAMSDGFDKVQAQRELDNKKEIQALKRQKEDYIRTIIQAEKEKFDVQEELKAKQIKGYNKKTFDSSSVIVDASNYDKIIENTRISQGLNEWEQREASMNEYLLKYGTFTQKKEAIDKKYIDAIEKEADLGKKNSLQKEWDEQLANLDLTKLKSEINWEMIFGDLSKVTKDQLAKIKKQLQEFKKSPEFKNATPEQIQVIEGAINSINDAMVDKGGFFGGLADSLSEYEEAVNKVKEAQEELEEALRSGDEAAIEKAQKKKNAAEQNQANAQITVENSKDKAINNITAVANAMKQLGSAEFNLSSFGTVVGGLVDALSESGSKIGGIIAAILSLLDEFGKDGGVEFGKNIVNNVFSAIGGTIEQPFKMIFGVDFGLGGANYSEYDEMVAKYDSLLDVWDQLLDKKKAYIKESYGIEATKAGQEAIDLLKSEKNITKELASSRLGSGASAGSHSMSYRMWKGSYGYDGKNWKDVAPEISKALNGVDFSSMWSMLNMSSEQLEWIKINYSGLWANMDEDFRGYLDDIIQYGETEKEIIESINEQLTQTSFDSLFDSFLNTLMDMDASSKDFANNFEEYMRKAIFTSMFAKNYEDELNEWYKAFAKANDKPGGMTASDVKDLRGWWDNIVNGAISDREAWEQVVGSSSYSSQSSTSKGFTAMSQDTGEELNGRFTALQIAGEASKEQLTIQTSIQQIMAQRLETIYNFSYSSMTEMRDIIFDVMDILSDMKKDTAHLYFIRESLNKIENNTKGLTSK